LTISRKTLLFAGLLTFVVAIVALFPARVAYNWFAPPAVQLSGLQGTVWSGSAAEASAAGLYLRDLRWHLQPLRLFTGKLAASVEASPSSGFLEADVAAGLGGTISLSNVNGSLPLSDFASVARVPGLSGNASVQFEALRIRDGLPIAATGTLTVANLVAPMVDPGSIGGYRAEFFTDDSAVIASVEDVNGVFDLAGSLTISADRNYQFLGKVAATDGTSEKLRRQLRFLGSPNERGQHDIRLEGQL
jgi:general secretion pathway protein N